MSLKKRILITGGAGFIGSHAVRYFVQKYPHYDIINLDALTYAGNLANLRDIEEEANYTFAHGDITDEGRLQDVFQQYQITDVMHFAAESHVDRSITDPLSFIKTNVMGTVNLMQVAKEYWKADISKHVFYHVSTDEVYGSLGDEGLFREDTSYDPQSPYSASKASSDHFVRAYANTYGLQIKISNCSNNYGPYQFPEKLIPLIINNIKNKKPLPIYGDGTNVRDWLFVGDHVSAIDVIFHKGTAGETYNVGGNQELQNLELVHMLCDVVDEYLDRPAGSARSLITFVKDRPGHDKRYAIDCSKLENQLGWKQSLMTPEGIAQTVKWYLENEGWLSQVTSGAYRDYYQNQYQA
ncbi:MAG: dTDP-glucose 4,6-dehydratase [Saprospiraceae bacterium]|jgi:dTDP-glucose 4,6-dehydratase